MSMNNCSLDNTSSSTSTSMIRISSTLVFLLLLMLSFSSMMSLLIMLLSEDVNALLCSTGPLTMRTTTTTTRASSSSLYEHDMRKKDSYYSHDRHHHHHHHHTKRLMKYLSSASSSASTSTSTRLFQTSSTTATTTTPPTPSRPITLQGYVVAKRQLSKHLVFLDLLLVQQQQQQQQQDQEHQQQQHLCQAILKRVDYGCLTISTSENITSDDDTDTADGASQNTDRENNDSSSSFSLSSSSSSHSLLADRRYFDFVRKGCLHKGTLLTIYGFSVPTDNPGNTVVSIRSVEQIMSVPRQVQHIESLLRQTISMETTTSRSIAAATTTTKTTDGGDPYGQEKEGEGEGDNELANISNSELLDHVLKACSLDEVTELEIRQKIVQSTLYTNSNTDPDHGRRGVVKINNNKEMKNDKSLRKIAMDIFQKLPLDPFYPSHLIEMTEPKAQTKSVGHSQHNQAFLTPAFVNHQQAPDEWRIIPPSILYSRQVLESIRSEDNVNDDVDIDITIGDLKGSISTIHTLSVQNISSMFLLKNTTTPIKTNQRFSSYPYSKSDVRLEGWVQNRRRFSDNITVVVLVDKLGATKKNAISRIQCVLHPDFLLNHHRSGLFSILAAVGARIRVTGRPIVSNITSRVSFWVKSIELVQSTHLPSVIEFLLQNIDFDNDYSDTTSPGISIEETGQALDLSPTEKNGLRREIESCSLPELRWKANILSDRLQQLNAKKSKRSKSQLTGLQQQVLRSVRPIVEKYPIQTFQGPSSDSILPWSSGQVDPMTRSRSMRSRNNIRMPISSWETKKMPQIIWMTRVIEDVLKNHPEYGKRKLHILDVGGGKGLLAYHLVGTLDNIHVHVVDICQGAVTNGLKKANRNNRFMHRSSKAIDLSEDLPAKSTIDFQWADASHPDELKDIDADLVCALHACGHLTDVALVHAINRNASFVVAPCCFKSNRHLLLPSTHTQQEVHDWLGISACDWSVLKSVAEIQGDRPAAKLGMHSVLAVRAERVSASGRMNVDILSFPVQYSTRNFVMVGKSL